MQAIDKRRKVIKLPEATRIMGVSYSTARRILRNSIKGKSNFPYRKYTPEIIFVAFL